MNRDKRTLLTINLVGGAAVLGSYAWGLTANAGSGSALWGDLPGSVRPLYTVNMFAAALGYLTFTYFLFFRVTPEDLSGSGLRVGPSGLNALYLFVLIPSALWLPMTFAMIESPSTALWWAIRIGLATTGVASVGLLVALIRLRGVGPPTLRTASMIGCLAFCLQTAVLDALVWPEFFPV